MDPADPTVEPGLVLLDAGMLIGALVTTDPRHGEARPLVEQARAGALRACTTPSVLSEVYATLTWERAQPRLDPADAADAVWLLVAPPSAIRVLAEDLRSAELSLRLAAAHRLNARRVHDARHAAAALSAGVVAVYTYDPDDWRAFETDGMSIAGSESTLEWLAARQNP